MNNKKTAENTEDFFDDDFEVVYQEEIYSDLLRDEFEKKVSDSHPGRRIKHSLDDLQSDYDDIEYGDDSLYEYDRDDDRRRYDYDKSSYNEDREYDDYGGVSGYGQPRYKSSALISPAARTAKTSVTLICRFINLLLHSATLILIAVIIYILAKNFQENLSTYGDPFQAIAEKNYTLAAYAAVAVFLLLFEVFSFLLVLTTSKRNNRHGRRVDTGRGLFSFIFIYTGSYLSFFLNGLIPPTPAPLQGIQGAVWIYGSMRSVLLPLCIAGIISCLVRKFAVH